MSDRDEDINWWVQQDSDEQWIAEQMRRYEEEQWEAEQDARKWAAEPEEQDLNEPCPDRLDIYITLCYSIDRLERQAAATAQP